MQTEKSMNIENEELETLETKSSISKFSKMKLKASGIAAGVGMAIASPLSAFAAGEDGDTPSADSIVGEFIGILLTIFRYVGIVLLVVGIVQFVMATKDDNPEAKVKATTMAIVSVILITLKFIVSGLLGMFGVAL